MTVIKSNVEKFNGENDFGLWRMKMRDLLSRQGYLSALQGRDKLPERLSDEEKDELMEKTHGAIILNLDDNEDRVLILLCSLPKSYEHLVITLLYGRETISMEDVKSALNSSELRKKVSADYVEESANGLMVRGRRNDKASSSRGSNKVAAFAKGDSDGVNVLSVIDDRSSDEWILDSGCSYHLCRNRECELDLELAPTFMINYDLEHLEIITFASSLQYYHESCYLVNLVTSGPTCSYFSFVLKAIE
ncbi:hypothetical protein Tco_0753658 [Tanacetum coccineum]